MAELKEQSLRLWHSIGKKEKYIIIGSAVLVFAIILIWSFWWGSRPDNVPLFTGLDAKDAGEVAAKLKEAKIPYEIGNNGTSIMVSSKDVYKIRLDLAAQGLPRGNKGFEIFDQNKFGTTEFQNKIYYLQAIQGELTKTIEQMAEVEKARVHIVLPEDSLYKKNEKPATASIMLKLKPSAQLNPGQVKGIVNLVSHSIQGLKSENITILDDNAHVLNDPSDGGNSNGISLSQLDMTKKVQDDLQKNLQSMLEQVLGAGKVASRVNVELNFDQRTVDKNTFEPVVDDKGIVRSSQDTNETYSGASGQPGGIPGTASNVPGYVATNNNNSQSNYAKKEAVRNYEINETKEKTVAAPGSIKRLTVAVLVDGTVTNVQQDSIMRIVASATGLNPQRGDVISVENVPFNTELSDKKRQEEADLAAQQRNMWILGAAIVLAVGAGIFFWLRARARRRQAEQELEALEMESTATLAGDEPEERELTKEELTRQKEREAIEKFAKSQPEDVAQLLKTWLVDE